VVGEISLHPYEGARRHAAVFGMSVHDAYQGRGVGTALLEACLDLADRRLLLDRVELNVYPDNEPALRLYRKFGFQEEGTMRRAALRDGRLVDLLAMARIRGRALGPRRRDQNPGPLQQGRPPSSGLVAGPGVRIRPVRVADAEAIHTIRRQRQVARETGLPPSLSVEQVRKELAGLGPADHVLVAEVDGQVVGMAHLRVLGHRRGHVGQLRLLAVLDRFQGRGIGSRLAAALVNLGTNWLGVRRFEAEIPAGNARALQLLHRLGFRSEVRKRAALLHDGVLADTILLARLAGEG
ncbi:MAG TPA: GNAT family N-acetyltransferase, partial [Thermaerobacter sp.]